MSDDEPVEEAPAADLRLARLASINLNLLVPLMALLEERSVTRAAARVGITQPAMSHALRRMRRLLDDELIVRRGNAMLLTPRALDLVEPLRQALHQTARVVDLPAFDPAVDSRVVSLAMTSSTAFVIGATAARLLGEKAPNVTLRLRTQDPVSEDLFADEGVDVLLLSVAYAAAYPRERLYDDRWVVVVPRDAPRVSAVELLTTLPHVVFDATAQRPSPYLVLDEHQVSYRIRDRVSDWLLIPYLVAGSGGVAVFRYRDSVALRAAGVGLRIEEFPFPIPGLGIDMVWNPWVDDSFKDWLRGLLVEAAEDISGPR